MKINKIAIFMASMFFCGSSYGAGNYEFTDLTPGYDLDGSALAINNNGIIVGFQSILIPSEILPNANIVTAQPVLWNSGNLQFLPTPAVNTKPGSPIVAESINNAGNILIETSLSGVKDYLLSSDQIKNINQSNLSNLTIISDINDAGTIIGSDKDDLLVWNNNGDIIKQIPDLTGVGINDNGHMIAIKANFTEVNNSAVLIKDNQTSILGDFSPTDINNKDQVIGGLFTPFNNERAVLWDNGNIFLLDRIDGFGGRTFANAINDFGVIVGQSYNEGHTSATIWLGNYAIDLNNLIDASVREKGWVLTSANDINEHGVIIGQAINTFTHVSHAFALTPEGIPPVPEPSTWAMLLAGIGLFGFRLHRTASKAEI